MNELTDERLVELRALAEIASGSASGSWDTRMGAMGNPTGGPGYLAVYDVTGEDICQMQDFSQAGSDLASHIAAFDPPTTLALLDAARERDGYRESLRVTGNVLEEVIAERDELQRRLDAVEARHTPVTVRYGDVPDELACRACGTHYEYPVAWPCPTVKAARGEA